MKNLLLILTLLLALPRTLPAQKVISVWPDQPPGGLQDLPPEEDITKPKDRLIAGERIVKLANVANPEMHIYQPEESKRNGSAVVICPGGGFSILAWDLEGTEVAEWFNGIGVTAFVLKYRVPTRSLDPKWKAPVQDAQRTLSYVREHADEWEIDPQRIGILGFSAGGHAAARATLLDERQYEPIDEVDQHSCKPDAAMLIYAAYLDENGSLQSGLTVDENTPPMFLVHAFDDRIKIDGPLLLALELKKHNVPFDLHIYESGDHGYGLRHVEGQPVTTWPTRCEDWLNRLGWLEGKSD